MHESRPAPAVSPIISIKLYRSFTSIFFLSLSLSAQLPCVVNGTTAFSAKSRLQSKAMPAAAKPACLVSPHPTSSAVGRRARAAQAPATAAALRAAWRGTSRVSQADHGSTTGSPGRLPASPPPPDVSAEHPASDPVPAAPRAFTSTEASNQPIPFFFFAFDGLV